ncbi:MAG: hypothetical protein P4K94_11580 [Terracidiphilus sp.]|nr:hypothetical protein [Terracidiphilus sp.]
MHLNFAFTAVQILWTLTFAALLVLLVVLLGRDRVRRFPWFTASIAMVAVRLLASRMLFGRLAPVPLGAIFITLADVAAIVGLLVLVEVARRAFAGAGRRIWIAGTLVLLAVGAGVLATWGPWPAWKTLTADSGLSALRLMQLLAQKGDLLLNVLTIGLGLLVVAFGSRFKAGWRSHVQQIVVGLSTAALAQLAVQGVWQLIALKAMPHSEAEYERILGLREKLFNANSAVFVAVLVWWIVCLWMDEKGTKAVQDIPAALPSDAASAEHVEVLESEEQ